MRWRVPLIGNETELRRLAEAHSGDDLRVVFDARLGFLLEAQRFEQLDDSTAVYSAAKDALETINGIARLLYGAAPVRAAEPYEITPDGKTIAAATAVVTMRAVTWMEATVVLPGGREGDGASKPAASHSARLLALAEARPAVKEALLLYGAGDGLTWGRMYSLLEIIEGDAGGLRGIAALSGVSQNAIANLQRTACAPAVVGVLEARHGVQRQPPPPQPMTIGAARTLTTQMLCAWLESRAAAP